MFFCFEQLFLNQTFGVGGQHPELVRQEATLLLELGLDLVNFALNGLDRSVGELVRLVLCYLLALVGALLLLHQEPLNFLPTLVSEDTHGYFEGINLRIGPSHNPVLGVGGDRVVCLRGVFRALGWLSD